MSFQSLHFLLFAVVVYGLNVNLLKHPSARKNMLLASSYYFYMCWDWRFSALLLVMAAVNYYAAKKISASKSHRARKAWLSVALLSSLGILAFFKYANFFIESLAALLGQIGLNADTPTLSLLLPIGISFFTFQGISYTIDVYRGQQAPSSDFRDFSLFIAFFPTVLSGPITRGRELLPQFETPPPLRTEVVQEGIYLILRGFAKKIFFADVLATHIVNPAFSQSSTYTSAFLVVAVVAYSFQIYMDLSGYTDIARGVTKSLGFELPENFRRPYHATSVSNFWQRWHISMSSFFRDYLYFGVGGSKKGNVYLNLLTTFVAIGMWHGAGWNFIVYGLLHGIAVSIERWLRNRKHSQRLSDFARTHAYILLATLATFAFVAFSRILFRSQDLQSAVTFFESLASGVGNQAPYSATALTALTISIALHFLPLKLSKMSLSIFLRMPAQIQGLCVTFIALGMLALSSGSANFVYFQF